MPAGHLISRVSILGTGLIGGSFALALRKYTTDMHISGWDRAEVVREAHTRGALDEAFSADLAAALHNADLIYIALPIAATLDLLPEIARHAPSHASSLTRAAPKSASSNPRQSFIPHPMDRSSSAAIPWPAANTPASPMPTPISFVATPTL